MQHGRTWLLTLCLCLAGALGRSGPARAQGLAITYEGNSRLFSFNPDTGASSFIGYTGVTNMSDLARASDGIVYASSLSALYTVNPQTAATTRIGSFGATGQMVGLDFTPSGVLLGVGADGGVFQVNPLSGAATTLFTTGYTFTGDIAHDSGNVAYATASLAGGSHLIALDLGTQTTADRGVIFSGQLEPGLDFAADGRLLAFANSGQAYNIPNFATSGSGTLLSTSSVPYAGVTMTPVPEPTSVLLVSVVCCIAAAPVAGGKIRPARRPRTGDG